LTTVLEADVSKLARLRNREGQFLRPYWGRLRRRMPVLAATSTSPMTVSEGAIHAVESTRGDRRPTAPRGPLIERFLLDNELRGFFGARFGSIDKPSDQCGAGEQKDHASDRDR
jgi:hypothetical protein